MSQRKIKLEKLPRRQAALGTMFRCPFLLDVLRQVVWASIQISTDGLESDSGASCHDHGDGDSHAFILLIYLWCACISRSIHISAYHEFHEACRSVTFIILVNSQQRWKQTRFRVCFHLCCELTSTINVTEWKVSWNSWFSCNTSSGENLQCSMETIQRYCPSAPSHASAASQQPSTVRYLSETSYSILERHVWQN